MSGIMIWYFILIMIYMGFLNIWYTNYAVDTGTNRFLIAFQIIVLSIAILKLITTASRI